MDFDLCMGAITNVLSHAVGNNSPNGTVSVAIEENDNNVFIVITNTGIGFSQKALEHAAEQFFMDDLSRNSKSHSSIGLYVANAVFQKHGGKLILENYSGGARVSLIIPVKQQ